MLHSFYTGIENMFKGIALELDGAPPSGESWRRSLLDAIARASNVRKPLISAALREGLRKYLAFRHVFRQAYGFELRWAKMRSLVLGCDETFRSLENELEKFKQAEKAS